MKDDRRREAEEMTAELKGYVREGVSLWLDGQRCSPGRAASACLLREDSCYMRDYVCDEQNRVVAIHFDRVEPDPTCGKSRGRRRRVNCSARRCRNAWIRRADRRRM